MTNELTEEQLNELKEAFAEFDTNNNGAITSKELSQLMHTLGMCPKEAELKVSRLYTFLAICFGFLERFKRWSKNDACLGLMMILLGVVKILLRAIFATFFPNSSAYF